MKIPFLDLKRTYLEVKDEILTNINDVLDKQCFINCNKVAEFEEKFAKYLGVKNFVSVGSGTDALKLSVEALKIGGNAITVPNTFVSTVDSLHHNGMTPNFADIHKDTFNIDISKSKANEKTSAIIPVHMYGQLSNMEEIREFSEDNNLKIIEDSCQAHGAEINGKKAGTFGDLGCFSFYPTKNLGGYGDSGGVATDNDELAEKIRMLRNYGSKKKYYHKFIGHNSRMDEIQAAVLIVKLKHLDDWNNSRRKIAEYYNKKLKDVKDIELPVEKVGKHIYYTYVIKAKRRNQLQEFLKNNGISTLIHYPIPVHKQKTYSEYSSLKLPVAENSSKEILSLPMYPSMSAEEVEYVSEKIREFYSL